MRFVRYIVSLLLSLLLPINAAAQVLSISLKENNISDCETFCESLCHEYSGNDSTIRATSCLIHLDNTLRLHVVADYRGNEPTEKVAACKLVIRNANLLTDNDTYYTRSSSSASGMLRDICIDDSLTLRPGTYNVISKIIYGDEQAEPDDSVSIGRVRRSGTTSLEYDTITELDVCCGVYLSISAKSVVYKDYYIDNITPALNTGEQLSPRNGHNAVAAFSSFNGKVTDGSTVVKYYDAIGRHEQTVEQSAVSGRMDLLTPQEYDGWGREGNSWLPIVTSQSGGDYVEEEQWQGFAESTYGKEQYPYTTPVYESSPLARVVEKQTPGADWRSAGRSLRLDEQTNRKSDDRLRCLQLSYSDGKETALSITCAGEYADGTLLIESIQDEDSISSLVFRDRLGRTLLSRSYGTDGEYHDTYYVYNDFNDLCAVLPPSLSAVLTQGEVSEDGLDKYAYLYKYDSAGNVIAGKLPGASWAYYIYNKYGSRIFSQDGEQRKSGEWSFTLPDVYGRPCLTGVCKLSVSPFSAHYLDSDYSYTCSFSAAPSLGGYTVDGSMPSDHRIYGINYYDSYAFLQTTDSLYADRLAYVAGNVTDSLPSNARGRLTGSCKVLLGPSADSVSLHSAIYYDNRGRILQSVSEDHLGGTQRDAFTYDFAGNCLTHIHHQLDSAGCERMNYQYGYVYDHDSRVVSVTHSHDSKAEVTLLTNSYDSLGRLSQRSFHNGAVTSAYEYNLRGWLTGYTSQPFRQSLHYTDGHGQPRYGGGLSSMSWSTGSTVRGYMFSYDGLGRLKNAGYGEGEALSLNKDRYSERVTAYDREGNILGLKRHGMTGTDSYDVVDDLSMSYDGNRLLSVTDASTAQVCGNGMAFTKGSDSATPYEYNDNGSLTKDLDKYILDIQYNWLSLPCHISFADGSEISYVYDSGGTKLRTVRTVEGVTTTTDYCDDVIYENGVPEKLLTEAGYITLADGEYHYFITDHQGNNRVVVGRDGEVEEINDYYPFGALMSSSSPNGIQPYKYNGKELDRTKSLNLYDYGARQYDPLLARWHVVDPMAEKYYSISPYVYCLNNPIIYIDPNGRKVYVVGSEKDDVISQLQHRVGRDIKLGIDEEGRMYYNLKDSNIKLKRRARRIAEIIDNPIIRVNLYINNSCLVHNRTFVGGAFMGNSIEYDDNLNINEVYAVQEVNPLVLKKMSYAHERPGADMFHELTEAYEGAKISIKKRKSSNPSFLNKTVYKKAHRKASLQSGRIYAEYYDKDNNLLESKKEEIPKGTHRIVWFVYDTNQTKTIIQKHPLYE
jgi:RHS repeat-associated protein